MTNIETVKANGEPSTTRNERRQTLAKLVLGHLIEGPIRMLEHTVITRRGEFAPAIAADLHKEFPSERLLAHVMLALDPAQIETCRMRDLDDLTVDGILGGPDRLPGGGHV